MSLPVSSNTNTNLRGVSVSVEGIDHGLDGGSESSAAVARMLQSQGSPVKLDLESLNFNFDFHSRNPLLLALVLSAGIFLVVLMVVIGKSEMGETGGEYGRNALL